MKYIILILAVLILLSGCSKELNITQKCSELGGTWLERFSECESISREDCKRLGGSYNECASACRNDKTAEICTMNCVQVCKFS